jgi:hypothetical protein
MTTIEKLVIALTSSDAPIRMIKAAESGRYDDFKSNSETPIMDLVSDLQKLGLHDLAQRAMDGEFDASQQEADDWAKNNGYKS